MGTGATQTRRHPPSCCGTVAAIACMITVSMESGIAGALTPHPPPSLKLRRTGGPLPVRGEGVASELSLRFERKRSARIPYAGLNTPACDWIESGQLVSL